MFVQEEHLRNVGFKYIGKNVKISIHATFYNVENISIGDNTRIDDFCILSAGEEGIEIGNHVHIACYSSLIGQGKITLEDYSNISSRVSIYSSNDDYSGEWMTNPTVSNEFTNVNHQYVIIHKHVVIGSGSVILPGSIIGLGSAVGALSLVKSYLPSFGIYAGCPAKFIKSRSMRLLDLEKLEGGVK
jgi:galactoside O-acetyltransferase